MSASTAHQDTNQSLISAPGPKGLPVLGNLIDMGRDTLGFFEQCTAEYGDVTAFRLAQFPALLLNDSDLIEQVLVKQHQHYTKNKVFWRQLEGLLGNGLFTSEGSFWQRQRKMSAPAFTPRPLQDYAPHMIALTERRIAKWQDGQEIDLHKEMMGLALQIAAKTLLGAEIETDIEEIEKHADWVIEEVAARFSRPIVIPDGVPLPGHIRFRRGVAYFENLVYQVIENARKNGVSEDSFLSLAMQARDDDGNPMSDKQLRDEVLTMLLAGYETSALAMSWGFEVLGQHRDRQTDLAVEVKNAVGDASLTYADMPKLKMIENAIIELLRIYPPGWGIGREAKQDTSIGKYEVKKGTTVILSPWVTQRDARYFEAPLEYRPERWTAELRKKLPRFAYFPFGGGPRICIGNRFAMMEAMLLLGTIVRRFDVERIMEKPVKPFPSITLRPVGGVWVKLHQR